MVLKRKVEFSDEVSTKTFKRDPQNSGATSSMQLAESHAKDENRDMDDFDSDEGEQDDKNHLDIDEIEGQEDGEIRKEQGITITPFNLEDEMEEGHFDDAGSYVFHRQVKDEWLESIDDDEPVKKFRNHPDSDQDENDPGGPSTFSEMSTYQKIVTFLNSNETVLSAVRRYGQNKSNLSASQRLKLKKQAAKGLVPNIETTNAESEKLKEANLLELTSLADSLLQRGYMSIYSETKESLNFKVSSIFPESVDVQDKDEMWEWKENMRDEDDDNAAQKNAEFFTTSQMKEIVDGRVGKQTYVRRTTQNSFYDASRIDFTLYL